MSERPLNPIESPDEYDVVYFAGVPTPGLAVISGADEASKWDKKDGPGQDGVRTTYQGPDVSDFEVKVYLWTAEHFAEWEQLRPLLRYDPSKKTVQAISVEHPDLAQCRITSVVVTKIGARVKEGKGKHSYTITCMEYRPPTKSNSSSTPSSTKSGDDRRDSPNPPQPPDEPSEQEKEIDRLLKIAQEP